MSGIRTLPEYQDFLEKLRKTPRDWIVNDLSCIRRGGTKLGDPGCQCPMWAVYGNAAPSRIEFNWYVVIAADHGTTGFDKSIRQDLLEACGLKELE